MRSGEHPVGDGRQRGFTYLGLLFIVALVGAGLGLAASSWTLQQHRQIEREQIWRGQAIGEALARYHAGPQGRPSRAAGEPGVAAAAPPVLAAAPGGPFAAASAPAVAASAPAEGDWPRRLEDLLEDRRAARPVRHLRKLYADPCTGRPDWQLERNSLGGIVAVRSRCDRRALLHDGLDSAPTGVPRLRDRRFGGVAELPPQPDDHAPPP